MSTNIVTVEEVTRMFDSCVMANKTKAELIVISAADLWRFNPNIYIIGNIPAICYLNANHDAGMDGYLGCKFLEYSLQYLINHTGLVDSFEMIDNVCSQVYDDTRTAISIDAHDGYAIFGFTQYVNELSDALDTLLNRYFPNYLLINQLVDFTQNISLRNRYLIVNVDCTYYSADRQTLTLMAKKFIV